MSSFLLGSRLVALCESLVLSTSTVSGRSIVVCGLTEGCVLWVWCVIS